MKRIAFFMLILSLNLLFADPKAKSDLWLMHYYEHKNIDRLVEEIDKIDEAGLFTSKPSIIAPTIGIISGVIYNNRKNPLPVIEKFEKSLRKENFPILASAIWYSDMNNSKKLTMNFIKKHPEIEKHLPMLKQGDPVSLMEIPLEQGPWLLDALWGRFMATGDAAPVKRVVQALKLRTSGNPLLLSTYSAAAWSIASNMKQHKRVDKIVREELNQTKGVVKITLREIIEAFDKIEKKKVVEEK